MQRLGLDAVDLDVELRHRGAERRLDALQRALGLRVGDHGLRDRLQLAEVAIAVAQLDLHGKSGGIADALDRRRWQHQRPRLLNDGKLVVQSVDQRAQILAGAARIPVFQDDIADAGIGEARAVVECRDAGNGDDLRNARGLACNLGYLVEHLLGAVERGTVGQLHRRDQIALVFDRQETGGHARQAVTADRDQDQGDDDRDIAVRGHAADQPGIAALEPIIDIVEAPIKKIALLWRHRAAQPQRALRRLQGRRVDGAQ